MSLLKQAIQNLTRLTSLSTRVLPEFSVVSTALVQRPPFYTVPAFSPTVGVAGYIAGGGNTTLINKLAFPADTITTLSATLSASNEASTGFANSAVAGYIAGNTPRTNALERILFSNDTRSTLSATLASAKNFLAAMANNAVAGYCGGGQTSGGSVNTIDKVAFPAETISALSATLSTNNSTLQAMANIGVAGYFTGGYSGVYINAIDKITFSADTRSTLSATLSTARGDMAAAFANINAVPDG